MELELGVYKWNLSLQYDSVSGILILIISPRIWILKSETVPRKRMWKPTPNFSSEIWIQNLKFKVRIWNLKLKCKFEILNLNVESETCIFIRNGMQNLRFKVFWIWNLNSNVDYEPMNWLFVLFWIWNPKSMKSKSGVGIWNQKFDSKTEIWIWM